MPAPVVDSSEKAQQPLRKTLFDPVVIGGVQLKNRVFMAPLTRLRGMVPGDLPYDLSALYYAQRASSGLLIAEATNISPYGKGYGGAPGIWSEEQIIAWKKVTDAVHKRGGRICLQLWHTGRISHTSLQPKNQQPLSASTVKAPVRCTIRDELRQAVRVDCSEPRSMTIQEIKDTVQDYAMATVNAKAAGFDFVELHGAHGYLLHQFIESETNKRTDEYGGSVENRCRFALEALDAMVRAWDADHVGIRISPIGSFNGLASSLTNEEIMWFIKEIGKKNIAFLHISESDWVGGPSYSDDLRRHIREAFPNAIIGAGAYTKEKGNRLVGEGLIDAAAFGRAYIANPDLVERLREASPTMNVPRKELFYGGGAEGYVDYPTLSELKQEAATLKTLTGDEKQCIHISMLAGL